MITEASGDIDQRLPRPRRKSRCRVLRFEVPETDVKQAVKNPRNGPPPAMTPCIDDSLYGDIPPICRGPTFTSINVSILAAEQGGSPQLTFLTSAIPRSAARAFSDDSGDVLARLRTVRSLVEHSDPLFAFGAKANLINRFSMSAGSAFGAYFGATRTPPDPAHIANPYVLNAVDRYATH
jgi:hypothetical protein